jgi:hypothetical protein
MPPGTARIGGGGVGSGSVVPVTPAVPDDADPTDDASEVRAERDRLRELVGPDERAYTRLVADVAGARDAAREAEAEAGRLRGRIAEMQVQLVRARQDQERYQRVLDARRALRERLAAMRRRLRRP